MENVTYQDLYNFLKKNPQMREQTITVRLGTIDEYFPARIKVSSEIDCDVLDNGHLFLEIEE